MALNQNAEQEFAKKVKAFVENNPRLVSRKETSIPGVFLLKYNNRVFFDNLWNESPVLIECRGTLVDADYRVVSRPFTKVFNWMENGASIDDDSVCELHEKINGFMAAVCYYNGEVIVSTTGSTDSAFVEMAKRNLQPYMEGIEYWLSNHQSNVTFIFEIVDTEDPHIIPQSPGVYLIGMRDNEWLAHPNRFVDSSLNIFYAYQFKCHTVEKTYAMFKDVKQIIKKCRHEGYMVYDIFNNKTIKMKSPHYLFSKFLARKSAGKLKALFSCPLALRQTVDEEFYGILDMIQNNLGMFANASEQERLDIIRDYVFNYIDGGMECLN